MLSVEKAKELLSARHGSMAPKSWEAYTCCSTWGCKGWIHDEQWTTGMQCMKCGNTLKKPKGLKGTSGEERRGGGAAASSAGLDLGKALQTIAASMSAMKLEDSSELEAQFKGLVKRIEDAKAKPAKPRAERLAEAAAKLKTAKSSSRRFPRRSRRPAPDSRK